MSLESAMADAILRAILARPLLSVMSDAQIPTELWDSAYAYDRARRKFVTEDTITRCNEMTYAGMRYYDSLAKFSDDLPEILKNLESENE